MSSLIVGFASTNDKFRDRTNASPPLVLRAKRCACGKTAHAKQLVQYGACVTCVRAANAVRAAA